MLRPPPRPALFPYTTLFRSKLTFEIEDGLAPVDQPDIEPWLALHIAKRGVHQARVKPQGGVPPVDLQGSPGGDKRIERSARGVEFDLGLPFAPEVEKCINVQAQSQRELVVHLVREGGLDVEQLEGGAGDRRCKGPVVRIALQGAERRKDGQAGGQVTQKIDA